MIEYLQMVLSPSNPVGVVGIIAVILMLARQLSQ